MDYSTYSQTSPQWTKFLGQHPQLGDLDKVSVKDRRRIFTEVEATLPPRILPRDVQEAPLSIQTFSITARDGYDIPVRSYMPTNTTCSLSRPVFVYLHAGGFLFGDLESGDMNCRVLSSRLDISVLNVGYRLAPQWPFPHGLHDSYDATVWAAANAATCLHASPTAGFLVGGISSGANFAGVIAYMARDAGLSPPITGLFLSVPVCIMPDAYPLLPFEQRQALRSLDQNADNPLLTKQSLDQIQNLYRAPPSDLGMSFLLHRDHSRLPGRAYFQICGGDPLRDEAFLWDRLVREYSGTRTMIHVYQGMPHGFWRFLGMDASQNWWNDLVEGIGFLCGRGEDREPGQSDVVVKGI